MGFSANLGFLFTDMPLIERVAAAADAGFTAVECHFPYDTDPSAFREALRQAGLPLLGLNTRPGDVEAGDFGLAALPDRAEEARAEIDRAVDYASKVGAGAVHVMAGRTDSGQEAETAYRDALAYACETGGAEGLDILIEPINRRDVERYHLATVEHAVGIIDDLRASNLKIMFDCYHVQIMQGDLTRRFEAHVNRIGHVQIAAVPDRGEPDRGEVSYPDLIRAIRAAGFSGPIGAEYRPRGSDTWAGLGWLRDHAATS